jgi:hypothetical protein
MEIKLPDGSTITWQQFCEAFPTEYVQYEIDREILEKLLENCDDGSLKDKIQSKLTNLKKKYGYDIE